MRGRTGYRLLSPWLLLASVACSSAVDPGSLTPETSYDVRSEGRFPPPPATPAQSANGQGAPVWRVQVFAGTQKAVAERISSELEGHLQEAVYVEYVESYYKVRVGNCMTRESCNSLVASLQGMGFQSVWVVPARLEP